jgi:hypothetical protein
MAVVNDGQRKGRINELASNAYLGDPQAMAELYGVAPQVAESLERTSIMGGEAQARSAQAREQARLNQQRESRLQAQQEQQVAEAEREFATELAEEAARLETYEEAQSYIQTRSEQAGIELPPMSEEQWTQFKTIYNDAADQRDRKIEQYQEVFGMSLEDAIRAQDANVLMDDVGNLSIYDPTTGNVERLESNIADTPDAVRNPTETDVADLAYDPAKGTGFARALVGVWNDTFGQVPFLPFGKDTAETAQNLRLLERNVVSAYATSSRPPLIEQNRIMALIPGALEFFQNPEEAQFQVTNIVDLMMNQYIDDIRFFNDRKNPREVRNSSKERANKIESVIRQTLVPEAADAMFRTLNNVEAEIGEIREMSLEELVDLDIRELTDSQLDIYEQRLRSGN